MFEEDHEDGEVGGGDAGDAGGVSERDGSVKGKLLFGFVAEVWDGRDEKGNPAPGGCRVRLRI